MALYFEESETLHVVSDSRLTRMFMTLTRHSQLTAENDACMGSAMCIDPPSNNSSANLKMSGCALDMNIGIADDQVRTKRW
jgi:hypothetical protein